MGEIIYLSVLALAGGWQWAVDGIYGCIWLPNASPMDLELGDWVILISLKALLVVGHGCSTTPSCGRYLPRSR